MAASPTNPPQAPVPSTQVERQDSSTGRFLLSEFESVNEPQLSGASKAGSLSVDTNIEFKNSTTISPNCVMNLPAPEATSKDEVSASESEQTANDSPLVKAAQYDFEASMTTYLPTFTLHESLMRNLTQAQLNRISFYGAVIHDINKEATEMAGNDTSSFVDCNPDLALIDEEAWLINAIANRSKEETGGLQETCPNSFYEAIGEIECQSSNPLSNLNSSRTQLWKPSRSWWEARSGKNPWIEPKSHNKRWRYLWPMIHYHKFLARCIKKLKRNGVEVHASSSAVCIFLRDEVCAISGHLANVSKFSSEEWLESLSHFKGWTDPCQEQDLRQLVKSQKLRCLAQPFDVDSSLLKDQIDEQFLRAMENSRLSMLGVMKATGNERKQNSLDTISEVNHCQQNGRHSNSRANLSNRSRNSMNKSTRRQNKNQKYPFYNNAFPQFMDHSVFQYPYPPRNLNFPSGSSMMDESMHDKFYPPHLYQQPTLHNAHQHYYSNQFSQNPPNGFFHHHNLMPMHTTPNHPHENFMQGPTYNSLGPSAGYPSSFTVSNTAPNGMNIQSHELPHPPGIYHPSPASDSGLQNPLPVPPSPYWGHLDPMAGLASPQNHMHPSRESSLDNDRLTQTPNQNNKQPFMNPFGYNFQPFARNYVPSPASQFMMSQTPQSSGRFSNAINMASHKGPSSFSFDASHDTVGSSNIVKKTEESLSVSTPNSKNTTVEEERNETSGEVNGE